MWKIVYIICALHSVKYICLFIWMEYGINNFSSSLSPNKQFRFFFNDTLLSIYLEFCSMLILRW